MDSMKSFESGMDSCPVCLQTYLYPTQLPCGHTFCFLCVKGSIHQNKGCPLCRQEIPGDFLKNPKLLDVDQNVEETNNETQWFYEGRHKSGWWKYDPRTNCEINAAVSNGAERCELLIADSLYIIDFVNQFQFRKNDPHRKRKIKRDTIPISTKGVAGIKFMSDIEITDKTTENNITDEHVPVSEVNSIVQTTDTVSHSNEVEITSNALSVDTHNDDIDVIILD